MALVTIRRSPSVQTPRKTNTQCKLIERQAMKDVYQFQKTRWHSNVKVRNVSEPPMQYEIKERQATRDVKQFEKNRWHSHVKEEVEKTDELYENDVGNRFSKSLNECYFANKGAAVVLGGSERGCGDQRRSPVRAQPPSDIQHHLQSMFYLLRPEETLKMAVKLESVHAGRTRYLVVVCRSEEAALLGIDCNERTSVGLVLRVLADTSIKLDGDGGFSVRVCNQQHIFKPVSVQAMWSALQTLHRASGRARELNHFAGGTSHAWCAYYESHVDSDRSCLNEWHAMDSIESRRPPSPDSLRLKPRERDETERVIRCTLKEIMMSVDLDEVTSKVIRGRLEDELDMDLAEYKSFIDQEMLTILGQMDAPTEIFDHVYLGSEWNASNLEELQRNGVRHILNVTREIDNFFPGMFDYLNIRVYDDEKTDLLKHWDNTFKYINKARNEGSKVLVHCKMGISRSASVVIAYAMKAFNWNFDKALKHVKWKRSCIKPNTNFLNQLETYQGILDAMKNKEKLQRSKSETNLKAPKTASKAESKVSDPTPLVLALTGSYSGRPRSWSPDSKLAAELAPPPPPTSVSLENLAFESIETRHMLMPCANGSYSVSPNQIIRLKEEGAPSVRLIVSEIENAASSDRRESSRRYQRLISCLRSDPPGNRASELVVGNPLNADAPSRSQQTSPSRNMCHKSPQSNSEQEKIHTWDPGEVPWPREDEKRPPTDADIIVKSDSGIIDVKNKVTSVPENAVDRNSEYEERRGSEEEAPPPPSRQSSWSSFDSAVVLDLSRHSSWGSYDTRAARPQPAPRDEPAPAPAAAPPPAKPACDLGIITEHRETRASLPPAHAALPPSHIADNERKFNETCAILKELASAAARMESARDRGASTWSGRLSASAPADTWLRAGLRRRRLACGSHGDLPRAPAASPIGLVTNLKKEFEARSDAPRRADCRGRTPPAEDLSVRVLVDRYDRPARARTDSACEPAAAAPSKAPHESGSKKSKLTAEGEGRARSRTCGAAPLRNSFCGAVRGAPPADRPPPAPTVVSIAPIDYNDVVVSTVMSKAQNKKQLQHGKTHPLTRLNQSRSNNNRCSNPVYNTM